MHHHHRGVALIMIVLIMVVVMMGQVGKNGLIPVVGIIVNMIQKSVILFVVVIIVVNRAVVATLSVDPMTVGMIVVQMMNVKQVIVAPHKCT